MSSPVRTPWTKVVKVIPLAARRLRIWREDGSELLLDLFRLVEDREAYWRLRNERYFQRVSVDALGGICWPEGEDLSPKGLERYAILEQSPEASSEF